MTFLPDLFRRRPRRPPQPRPPSPLPPPPPEGRPHEPIRLTTPDIAPQGCEPVGYSYWPNVNNHRGADHLYVFVGRVGDRPVLLRIMKGSWSVADASSLPRAGTAEGWYFSASRPHALYLPDGPRLLRYDVVSTNEEIVFTLQPDYGSYLWQVHSSADDLVHSATVRDDNYQNVGCLVVQHGEQRFFPIRDGYDECQIDKSGRWLVIKEGNGDNRIVDLRSGGERTITNAEGAVGHSDCGHGTLLGEDDQGARWKLVEWNLETLSQRASSRQRPVIRGMATSIGECRKRTSIRPASSPVLRRTLAGDAWMRSCFRLDDVDGDYRGFLSVYFGMMRPSGVMSSVL